MVGGRGRWLVLLCALVIPLQAEEVVLHVFNPTMAGAAREGQIQVIDPRSTLTELRGSVSGVTLSLRGGSSFYDYNGQVSHFYPVRLTVAKPGRYRLDGLTVLFEDGHELPITAIDLEAVVPIDRTIAGAQILLSPTRSMVGQEVEILVRTFTRTSRQQLAPPDDWKPPAPDGIEIGKLKRQYVGEVEDVRGSRWQVTTFVYTGMAVKPGTYHLAGQVPLGHVVLSLTAGGPVFTVTDRLALEPATWTSRELPVAGRPDDFAGLVGQVTITGSLDRDRIAEGEGCTLRVLIRSDQSNLILQPTIPSTADLQIYPQEDRSRSVDAITREFVYDLVPSGIGQHLVPSISLPWFDIDGQTYARAVMNPVTLTVLPGRTRKVEVAGATTGDDTTTPVLPPPLTGTGTATISRDLLLLALLLGLGGGALIACLLDGRRPRFTRHRGRHLRRLAKRADFAAIQPLLLALGRDHPEAITAIAALRQELEHRQFGGRKGDLEPLLAAVERLP